MDFDLNTIYEFNIDKHKSKTIKHKPNNLATMNTVNTNINIILNREENHLNIHDSCLEIEFVVSDNAGGVFANNANIRSVNYGMMALFSAIKLETNGSRTIEYIDHCHPNLLMYRLLTSTGDEYKSGFVRNQGNRDSQLKGDHAAAERGHMYMMVKMSDLFGFVDHLEKIMYGLGFKLILKRNNNDRVLFRVDADRAWVANDGNIEIRDISWCIPSTDPINDNRIVVQKGLNKKKNIDFIYYERKTFFKNMPNATNFLFDLGMESGMERPQYIIIGFENNNVNERTHDASTFDIMNVTECYCKIGSAFYTEDRMNINYGTKKYNEALKEIVGFNKDYNGLPHNIKPYINHRTFKSSYRMDRMNINYGTNNDAFKEIVNFNKDFNGLPHNIKPYINLRTFKSFYKKYVFDTRYRNDHISPQPIQLNFKFSAAVADVICHALVLNRKVISVNSDGNEMVDTVS